MDVIVSQILSNFLHLLQRIVCARTVAPMCQLIDQIYVFLLADLRINRVGTAAIKAMTRLAGRNSCLRPRNEPVSDPCMPLLPLSRLP